MTDWKKIYQAVAETVVPRHEYLATQRTCHKRGCPCHATAYKGGPEAALNLFTAAVTSELRTVELFGKTRRELALENLTDEQHQDQEETP